MATDDELTLRYGGTSARWWTALAALAAIAMGGAAGLGGSDANQWAAASACVGAGALFVVFGFLLRRVEAGPDGLRYRTVLRWHRLEWDEIVRLQEIQVMPNDKRQKTPNVRVEATLRSGEAVRLPVPWFGAVDAITFEGELRKLRAVRRRYTPTAH
ncbi:PH domain-containing protein [Streptomyces sp. NPDC056949]|uniref:PH domain-containing protein n=1 Tax=Streptomyces sp. NPDC056949 TaxID=3345976 RepID=UPI00363D7892